MYKACASRFILACGCDAFGGAALDTDSAIYAVFV